LFAAEKLAGGTHTWDLEQGYEMGRPSELHLVADVTGGKLTAVRVAGQAVQVSHSVLEL
jgi:trans-2,3-dihydro-3-hydroxyanthranilate isomerase